MWIDLAMVAGGLVLLVFGGDALVRGAVNLALRLGIPALIVGLTVVAFGTSAPELLVSIQAALDGRAGISLGNVVGSNVVNILLILGLPALLTTIHSGRSDTARSYWIMIAATLLLIGLSAGGVLVWWHGLILLAGLGLMITDSLRQARAHRAALAPEALEGVDPGLPMGRILLLLGLGLVGLGLGARLLVDGAASIARAVGVSETIIGLTLVALGTSLPELVTCIVAALRREADVVLGNVIGSNIFNIFSILGVTALIAPLSVDPELLRFDYWVMLAVALALLPFAVLRRDITRWVGIGFVGAYLLYAGVLIG